MSADVTGTEIVVDGGGIQMPMLGGQVSLPMSAACLPACQLGWDTGVHHMELIELRQLAFPVLMHPAHGCIASAYRATPPACDVTLVPSFSSLRAAPQTPQEYQASSEP